MSEYTAIRAISLTLKGLLEEVHHRSGRNVVLKSPKEMHETRSPAFRSGCISDLQRVQLNGPPQRTAMNLIQRQPLPVNLHH
jgi:hypothetical protein